MSHANAALTPKARLKIARLIVEEGWPVARAAERFDVSWPTANRWAKRYREFGPAGMADRSSRPHHQPTKTPQPTVRKIVHLRWKHRLGPVAIADKVGLAASTVHAVLIRCRLNRLSHVTGRPASRSDATNTTTPARCCTWMSKSSATSPTVAAGDTSAANKGRKNRSATPGKPRSAYYNPKMGTAFVHTVIDDYSRVAYAEIHDDEAALTAVAVLRNAVAWFAARGVTTQRVLSDNGSCYRSHLWRDTCAELGIVHKRTRPYRPQTNGKIERFHRTLAQGWAFRRFYNSETARRKALPAWLHEYNHHRPHTAIGKLPPISRLTNVPGQYT